MKVEGDDLKDRKEDGVVLFLCVYILQLVSFVM